MTNDSLIEKLEALKPRTFGRLFDSGELAYIQAMDAAIAVVRQSDICPHKILDGGRCTACGEFMPDVVKKAENYVKYGLGQAGAPPISEQPVAMSRAEFGDKMAQLMLDTAPPPGKYKKTVEMLSRYIDCGYRVYTEAPKRESVNQKMLDFIRDLATRKLIDDIDFTGPFSSWIDSAKKLLNEIEGEK